MNGYYQQLTAILQSNTRNQSSERTCYTSREAFGRVEFEIQPFEIASPTAFETRPREVFFSKFGENSSSL